MVCAIDGTGEDRERCGDGVAGFTCPIGAGRDVESVGRYVGDPMGGPVVPHQGDPLGLGGPRHGTCDTDGVEDCDRPAKVVTGQSGRLEEPAGEQVVFGEGDADTVPGCRADQLGGLEPARTAPTVCFGAGEADETQFGEAGPQVGVPARDLGPGLLLFAVSGEHGRHHLDQITVDGCRRGHQRIPNPRAITPRRTSLVPPRSVNPGR